MRVVVCQSLVLNAAQAKSMGAPMVHKQSLSSSIALGAEVIEGSQW